MMNCVVMKLYRCETVAPRDCPEMKLSRSDETVSSRDIPWSLQILILEPLRFACGVRLPGLDQSPGIFAMVGSGQSSNDWWSRFVDGSSRRWGDALVYFLSYSSFFREEKRSRLLSVGGSAFIHSIFI